MKYLENDRIITVLLWNATIRSHYHR